MSLEGDFENLLDTIKEIEVQLTGLVGTNSIWRVPVINTQPITNLASEEITKSYLQELEANNRDYLKELEITNGELRARLEKVTKLLNEALEINKF